MKRDCRFLFLLAIVSLFAATSAYASTPTVNVLFSFPCQNFVCPDGYFPISLIEGADGNFYGVATGGGTGLNAQGTVFEITPSGAETVLYRFCSQPGCADGSDPNASLITGRKGNLYGTTLGGGGKNDGVVFKVTP